MTKGSLGRRARQTLSVFLAFIAALSVLITITLPSDLQEQAAENRQIIRHFEAASRYVTAYSQKNGRLPTNNELDAWAEKDGVGQYGGDLTADPTGCVWSDFEKLAGDQFMLSIWRGESSACYSYPSGKSNLEQSFDYLEPDVIELLLVCLVAAFGLAGLAWLAWPKRRTGECKSTEAA